MDAQEITNKVNQWFSNIKGSRIITWIQSFISESTGEGSSRRLIALWAMVLITWDDYKITHILDHAAAQRIEILPSQADLVHFIGTTVFIFLGGIVTAMITATTLEKVKKITPSTNENKIQENG